jgi:hypothetical protein
MKDDAVLDSIYWLSGPVGGIGCPLGIYMEKVMNGRQRMLNRFFGPLEIRFYQLLGIRHTQEMSARVYLTCVLLTNLAGFPADLPAAAGSASSATESRAVAGYEPAAGIQHGSEFRDEYELAVLSGRGPAQLSDADAGHDDAELCISRLGYCGIVCTAAWLSFVRRRRQSEISGSI